MWFAAPVQRNAGVCNGDEYDKNDSCRTHRSHLWERRWEVSREGSEGVLA
jgi:hypothetical protein